MLTKIFFLLEVTQLASWQARAWATLLCPLTGLVPGFSGHEGHLSNISMYQNLGEHMQPTPKRKLENVTFAMGRLYINKHTCHPALTSSVQPRYCPWRLQQIAPTSSPGPCPLCTSETRFSARTWQLEEGRGKTHARTHRLSRTPHPAKPRGWEGVSSSPSARTAVPQGSTRQAGLSPPSPLPGDLKTPASPPPRPIQQRPTPTPAATPAPGAPPLPLALFPPTPGTWECVSAS